MTQYREILRLGHPGVIELIWNAQSSHVAVPTGGGGILIYTRDFEYVQTLQGYIEASRSVAWSPDGNKLVCADTMSFDRSDSLTPQQTVQIWDLETGTAQTLLYDHPTKIATCVLWGPATGQIAASLSDDHTIHLWDPQPVKTSFHSLVIPTMRT